MSAPTARLTLEAYGITVSAAVPLGRADAAEWFASAVAEGPPESAESLGLTQAATALLPALLRAHGEAEVGLLTALAQGLQKASEGSQRSATAKEPTP
jgi:hypothetical protein